MRKTTAIQRTTLSIGILAATIAILAPTAAHASSVTPPPPDEESSEIVVTPVPVFPMQEGATTADVSAEDICTAYAYGDYPHISTSNPSSPLAVQSHGGWNRGDCAAVEADVTTQLDRKNPIGLFQAVGAQGRGVLPSQADFGLPSSNRVTARYECNGTASAPFRAWTSIDMIGIDDISSTVYTPATGDIACG